MKIIIAIHAGFTRPFGDGRAGGSETWAITLAGEFQKLGHEVETRDARDSGELEADLIVSAHTSILPRVASRGIPIIHTCHGILPALEQPIPGADRYVAVSEEVQAHMAARGFEAEIIRNPIDCEKFAPITPPGDILRKILFYSRYQRGTEKIVKAAFAGYDLTVWGGQIASADVPGLICDHDLVIGIGRSALEAMACGRNVIVYDYNGGDGFAMPANMPEIRKNNCSGRRYGDWYSPPELRRMAEKKYAPHIGQRLREFVIENNDAGKIARQYLELAATI